MLTQELILNLLLILSVAWALGYLFSHFGLPFMLGELLAGILLGPPLLGVITESQSLELMAEFGIFFVMLYAGIEMDPKLLLRHFVASTAVALGGFILPFGLGFLTTYLLGGTLYQSLFVGMGISITAIAIQAAVLTSMRINRSKLGHIIIGAAIVDDVLSLVGLSVLLGLAREGTIGLAGLSLIVGKVVVFFGLVLLVGYYLIPPLARRLTDHEAKGFTFAMTTALTLAYLAELAGLHLIIGAFLAGQVIRREIMSEKIYEAISDRFYGISYGLLLPVFFVSLSFHLHFELTWSFVILAGALIAAAMVGKIIGAGLPLRLIGYNNWESLVVGFGMNGRGAVELVVASVVIQLSSELMSSNVISEPLLTQNQFSALVLMAFVTTIMAPITMRWSVMRACSADEHAEFCVLLKQPSRF